MHVLIDSNIYRGDRKRNKPAFRAILRLAKAAKLHLHVPFFVKAEVLSQLQDDVRSEINKVRSAAYEILSLTAEANLKSQADSLVQTVAAMKQNVGVSIAADLQGWIKEAQAIEDPIAPDHGTRVAAAYFAGSPPFGNKKQRTDIPDSFIWEMALDLVQTNGQLIVVSNDGRVHKAADQHSVMEAYKSLEDLLKSPACQDAINELDASEAITNNIARIKGLLPEEQTTLQSWLDTGVVHELAWKTVRHHAIPEDNGEAQISSVNETENVTFAFTEVEHFGDGDLGIPFTATVDCELNFRIYRGDYYAMGDDDDISVSEWSDHYLDANKTYTLNIEGYVNLAIDTELLKRDDLTDDDLRDIIRESDADVDITERNVYVPEY
jgi:hypothetical protein